MSTPEIQITGTLHGLKRTIGKIGGEVVSLSLTSHDLEKWNRLVGLAETAVTITILPAQQELPMGDGQDGVQPGSEAATGAHQAQD